MIQASDAMAAAIEADVQHPDFKLLSYDISDATGDTWGAIISGSALQTPVDITAYVNQIAWSYERLSVTMGDPNLDFHPDSGSLRTALCAGRGIRLIQGYRNVPEDEWIPIFSGLIQGSYSWNLQRSAVPQVTVNVYSRESNQAWNRRTITSKEYTVGADWSLMFENIAKDVMGMDENELDIPRPWGLAFDKSSNQTVNIPPWEALTLIAQGNMSRIWFNGQGQLSMYPFTLDRVDRVLPDNKVVTVYAQPGSDQEIINKVSVTYIDNKLTKVVGAQTNLGTANITTGFFDFETKLDVFYSEDKKQRAENVKMIVKQSINQNDLGISIGSERLDIDDEFGGKLVVTVDFWVSALATAGVAAILASATEPDGVQVGPSGTGTTIPIGRIAEAAGIVSVLLAMMILGTGVYEIVGNPVDYAYLEKKAIAMVDNIKFWEEKEEQIRNDFISTEDHAHGLALNELLYKQSEGHPRTLAIQDDPRIERGDIIQLPNGAKIFVEAATKTIGRGKQSQINIRGFRSVV
jgi:hypothetical protein